MTQKALDKQVAGNHYKDLKIQPVQYIVANKLGYCEGNVIKYVTRHALKNGREDLLKAIHYLELLIEEAYPEKNLKMPQKAVSGFELAEAVRKLHAKASDDKLICICQIKSEITEQICQECGGQRF